MNDSEIWANGVLCGNLLLHGHLPYKCGQDAAAAVSEITNNVVLCGAPIELFSDEMPVYTPEEPAADDLLPIDVLYGQYNAETKTIKIFVKNIRRDAPLFGDLDDLLYLVRVHEHAHAVVHLGITGNDLLQTLDNIGSDGVTDWNSFTESRTSRFRKIDSWSHEFLAQAITYAVVTQHPIKYLSDRLTNTFLKLEKRQPAKYVVPDEVKKSITSTNWPMLLSAARGNPEVYQGADFEFVRGLRELALK